LALQRAAL